MYNYEKFYIDGQWQEPAGAAQKLDVINPASEQPMGRIALGSKADVDSAVAAARRAFETFSVTTREERVALLERVVAVFRARYEEMATIISLEMGCPIKLSREQQTGGALAHFAFTKKILQGFEFDHQIGNTLVTKEAVGVCGMITPWNWPVNQIACKVAAALAAGCTMVLKPSEIAPISAALLADILHEAGVPAGVFNLVNGLGPEVGEALARHPDIDMISITGSTRAGAAVAHAAADTIKRVTQELGGKSASIILDDADLEAAVARSVWLCMSNSGQTCLAPTRLLVPAARHDEAVAIAQATIASMTVGQPSDEGTAIGPLVSQMQFDKVQGLIGVAIEEGATLASGGLDKPEGLSTGYFCKPTLFSSVKPTMRIAQEEVFGPVLVVIPYGDEAEAVKIANDSEYGLAGYVSSGDPERAKAVARKMRTGYIVVNTANYDLKAPFGGYKKSGNGREWGEYGIEDFLEIKSIVF
jgi:aldehyde dehydrogenase (NAD+)